MSYSTLGRPRALTQAQIDEVLEWARNRMSALAKARSLGISPSTLAKIVASGGSHYKSAPPERRSRTLAERRQRRRTLEARGVVF